MTDIAPSASTLPSAASVASSAASATDLTRSASTPPDLDNLSSTNVFAFGLHSSYGAFANDSSAPLTAAPQTQSAQPAAVAAITAASLNMSGMLPIPVMPGMEQQHHSHDNFNKQAWHPTSPEQHHYTHTAYMINQHNHNHASPALPPMQSGSQQSSNTGNQSDAALQSLQLDFHNPYLQYINSLSTLNPLAAMPSLPLSLPSLQTQPSPFLSPLPMDPSLLSFPPSHTSRNPNPSICKFYAAGHCARGDQCNYAHVRLPLDGTAAASMAAAGGMGGMGVGMGVVGMGGVGGRGGGGWRGGGGGGRGGRGDGRGGRDGMRSRGGMGMRGGGGGGMYHRQDGHHNDHGQFHPMMNAALQQQKDGNSLAMPNPSSNPLSPLSPSLLGLNPLADPSLLMSHPSYPPLDYSLFPQPFLPADYHQAASHQHPSAQLGLAVNATSDDLIGRVYTFAKDQYGCRLLQRLLDDGRPGVLPVVYGEVYPHINELMTDPFGNYLCQKLLEHCDEQQRMGVLNKVASDIVAISLNLHGTRAVQKLVETVASVNEVEVLVSALKGSVVTLVKDLNGNHVIQRCLHHLSSNDNQFIYDAVCRHCVSVATHKHGCCVLQRCIDYATVNQKRQLIHEICNNALELVQDAYGNYVVQYVLDLNEPTSTSAIVTALCGHVSSLAVQKFSSNVIEKCVAAGARVGGGDGLSGRIEQWAGSRDGVMGWSGGGMVVGEVCGAMERGVKEVVEMQLEDGRRLQCTADHLVLTTAGWRRVQEMEVGVTRVLMGLEGVADEPEVDVDSCWTMRLPHRSVSMKDERPACLATIRLAGYLCGQYVDDHDDVRGIVSHAHDRHCVVTDAEYISDEECTFEQTSDGGWSIPLPCHLSSMLSTLLHQLVDKSCPFSVRREFVAALLGSCGSIDTDTACVSFVLPSFRSLCRALALLLPTLLRSLGMADCTVSVDVHQSIVITLASSSFLAFVDTVGCRYNVQLSYSFAALSSYLRHTTTSASTAALVSFKAYCSHIGCSDWLTSSSSAFCLSSLPTFHLLLSSVTPAGRQPTYDITVRHLHSFTANGLIVHNCLELSNDKLRTRLIDELTHPDRLPRLLSDPFANYCIQKALSVSKKGQAERLVAVIRPHLNQLRNTAFGKRIQSRIEKRFPELSEDELAGMFYRDGGMDVTGAAGMVGVPGAGVGVGGGMVAGGVSSIGGGVYDPAMYGERTVGGTGTSPPPLVSPTARQLNVSGPVGAVGGGVNAAELGINALLTLSSLNLSSNSVVSSSPPPPSSSSSPPPVGSFYQPFADSNGSAGGVSSSGGKDGLSPVGVSAAGHTSSLFSP